MNYFTAQRYGRNRGKEGQKSGTRHGNACNTKEKKVMKKKNRKPFTRLAGGEHMKKRREKT